MNTRFPFDECNDGRCGCLFRRNLWEAGVYSPEWHNWEWEELKCTDQSFWRSQMFREKEWVGMMSDWDYQRCWWYSDHSAITETTDLCNRWNGNEKKEERPSGWNSDVWDVTWTSQTTAPEAYEIWIATLIVHVHTQPQSHPEQWNEMRRRDGLFKSLHCAENNDWESWSVGSERVFHHESFSFESIVFIIMTVVIVLWSFG